jgi:hypothetical protein
MSRVGESKMDDKTESTFLIPRHMTPCREWSGHVAKSLNFHGFAPFSSSSPSIYNFISGLFLSFPSFSGPLSVRLCSRWDSLELPLTSLCTRCN